MTQARASRWGAWRGFEFFGIALIFHIIFTCSIFDIHFRSPVVHPVPRFQVFDTVPGAASLEAEAPARRAVVLVADGLRADTLFKAHAADALPLWARADMQGNGVYNGSFPSAFFRNGTGKVQSVTHAYAAPYLRTIAMERGRYGVSHTRVPTESRPGHVALLAGMYEDMSAVTKGWKVNPIAFDSLLNRSSHTYAFGSPDIVPMFALGTPPGKVDAHVYDEDAEDFTRDAVALDIWVLNEVRALLARGKQDAALDAQLRAPNTLFFLHLLGLDTTGHTYRPQSREYAGNTIVVDAIVREIEQLFDAYFADERTAYLLTADHGMSRRGNHGDGDSDNTRTPLVVWGAGVAKPMRTSHVYPVEEYYDGWGLETYERVDVEQAAITPLVSTLLGAQIPANNEGVLPDVYLDVDAAYAARAALANAKQVLEVYRVKHEERQARMHRFVPYAPLSGGGDAQVADIAQLIADGAFADALEQSAALIEDALDGARYLHKYDAKLLLTIVVLGYVGLFLYGITFLLQYTLYEVVPRHKVSPMWLALFALVHAAGYSMLARDQAPWIYYVYMSATASIWTLLSLRLPVVRAALAAAMPAQTGPKNDVMLWMALRAVVYVGLALASVQLAAYGTEHRYTWALLMLLLAFLWPFALPNSFKENHEIALIVWVLLCATCAYIITLPIEKEESVTMLTIGGTLFLVLGTCICAFPHTFLAEADYLGRVRKLYALAAASSKAQVEKLKREPDEETEHDNDLFLPRMRIALACELLALIASILVTASTARRLKAKQGLALANQVVAWGVLLFSLTVPLLVGFQGPRMAKTRVEQPFRQRIVLLVYAFVPAFVLLSLADEVLFLFVYIALVLVWAHFEAELARTVAPTPCPRRGMILDDVRLGIMFFLWLHIGFFGTGNIASISSFYLSPVYRLVPVFSPFLMATLLIFKLIVPFILLAAVLAALCGQLPEWRAHSPASSRVPILASGIGLRHLYIPVTVAALACDVLALNFLFSIRDTGSWLEIGQSITHFVMANLLQIYMLLLAANSFPSLTQRLRSQARSSSSRQKPEESSDTSLGEVAPRSVSEVIARRQISYLVSQLSEDTYTDTLAEFKLLVDFLSADAGLYLIEQLRTAARETSGTHFQSAFDACRDQLRARIETDSTYASTNTRETLLLLQDPIMFSGLPEVANGKVSVPPDANSRVLLDAALEHLACAPSTSFAPAHLAPFLAAFLSDPSKERPVALDPPDRTQLLRAVRECVGAEPLAQALHQALPFVHIQDTQLADFLLGLGADGLASLELAQALLAQFGWKSASPEQVAALLGALLSAQGDAASPNTDYGTLTRAITSLDAQLSWAAAIRALDLPEQLSLTPSHVLSTNLANVLLAAPTRDILSDPKDCAVAGLWGVWTHRLRHLQLLYGLLLLSEDTFSFSALTTRPILTIDDVAAAPVAVKAEAQNAIDTTWNALDLLETLMELAGGTPVQNTADAAKAVTAILERAIKTHAACVLLGLVQLPPSINAVHPELVTKLLTMFLAGHPHTQLVFWVLWHKHSTLLLEQLQRLAAESPLLVPRIAEVAHEIGFLDRLLEPQFSVFALDIAAVASRRDLLNLEPWLQKWMDEQPKDTHAMHIILDFLEGKVKGDLQRRDPQVEPLFVPLSVQTVATLLRVLRANGDSMTSDEIEHFKVVRNLCLQLYPRLMSLQPGAEASEPGLTVATFPKEIHREADTWYRQMYEEKVSVDDIIALLQRSRHSDKVRDHQLFACMVHTLFDEHRWFELYYPPRELLMTAVVFGSLIQHQLINAIPLGIAIRYVLDALRSPPDATMFHFGIHALLRFQNRLAEWPQLCQALLSLPHLQQVHPDVVALVDAALANAKNGTAPSVSDTRAFSAIYAESVTGDAQQKPAEALSDKILFFINNMSLSNVDEKLGTARELIGPDLLRWLARYIVLERVSTEPNNHELYMRFLEGLHQPTIFRYVLYETIAKLKVLLESEKTMQSTTERTTLKNLASWLGTITLARNKPILFRNIAFKELLMQGHESGRLIVVIPFVCKVLEQCANSSVFQPPNPWLMAVLRLLVELYQYADLKLNLKFEIEVLCKTLHVDLQALEPTSLLLGRRPEPEASSAVDPYAKAASAPNAALLQEMEELTVSDQFSTTPMQDTFTALLQNVAQYIVISPQLGPYANNAAWKRVMYLAIERAIQEIITPVVERSVTIAAISTRELASKDFAMEPDEHKLRHAAHQMTQSMAGSLALVTCKEPLRVSIMANARTLFAAGGITEQQLPEQALMLLVQDNLELACVVVEKTAMEKTPAKVDESLAAAYTARREFRAHGRGTLFWDSAALSHYSTTLPELLRIAPPGLSPEQLRVYDYISMPVEPRMEPEMQSMPETNELGGALSPAKALERFLVMASKLEQFFAEVGETQTLATLPSIHFVRQVSPHLTELVNVAAPRDEAILVIAQKVVQLLYRAQTSLAREVWVAVLEQLCEQSLKVAKEVTAWLNFAEDERKFNVPVTMALVRANLVGISEQDQQLAKLLVRSQFRASVVEFSAQFVQKCLHEKVAGPSQFAGVLHALQQATQFGRNTPASTALVEEAEELPRSTDAVLPLREQLAYSFASWVRVYQQSPQPEKSFIEYVTQLQSQNVLKGEEISSLFFRVCAEVSADHYLKQHALGGTLASGLFAPVDTLSKMVVYMIKYHADPLGADDEHAKVHYLTKILSIITLVLAQSHEDLGARFQQKPFFRLFSSLLHDLLAAEGSLHGAYNGALLAIANSLNSLQPLFFPGFAFAWVSLISHRLFLPELLQSKRQEERVAFHRLFIALLRFLAPFLRASGLHDTTRLLYNATLRILLVLLHDYPDYLVEHHQSLCDMIPPTCIQMRNLVLCAYPPTLHLPDPFAAGLRLVEMPEAQDDASQVYDMRAVLATLPTLPALLDVLVKQRGRADVLANLRESIAAPEGRYNEPAINAAVLFLGQSALQEKNLLGGDAKQDPCVEALLFLLHEVEPEGRYLLLNAAANQLRFPSRQTAYFSALVLHLYAHIADEQVREQIVRVLLERLIVHRPHPWGLLHTFAHLLQARTAALPQGPPEVHAILEHISHALSEPRILPAMAA
ncbi:CCR4-NOT core subunit cdc39 [Malassezia vespertilionis]|uniref:CCR4-NOT core subunit cdc39 n=1 Tax=Malassezia vespertilionis TaxID=2020962 RepID=UPI0024B1D85E|nr:CCR4-NOT core subunit cdc39 [Malassezia vespertilionis]WFD05251.1 CCR4-NOT core subunit cdc39 [Malassezia vespertilionis]